MTLQAYFFQRPRARRIFVALHKAVDAVGPNQIEVSKSQVAFRRDRAFAWAWTPDRYLRGSHAPLVLTVALPSRSRSPRWKEIVEPAPGRYTHHLELNAAPDIDAEVKGWLREAWKTAGSTSGQRSGPK
jgi:hypothetical protein